MELYRLSRQGNNIKLAPYNMEFIIVLKKHFAHNKFVIVNESEKNQLTHT